MKCPSCEQTISWRQKWRFSKKVFFRKAADCPHCSTKLMWEKWPHRLVHFGGFAYLFGFCSKYFFPIKIVNGFDLYFLCIILGCTLGFLGISRLKFEVISEN